MGMGQIHTFDVLSPQIAPYPPPPARPLVTCLSPCPSHLPTPSPQSAHVIGAQRASCAMSRATLTVIYSYPASSSAVEVVTCCSFLAASAVRF